MKNLFSIGLMLSALLIISNNANALIKVPEPSSLGLLGLGLLLVGIIGRKK